uniref:Uncharacterized protein n=1 Tax=Leersia perrieri TaxID=77586 RepID=A0A0D9UWP4_9ORYZ
MMQFGSIGLDIGELEAQTAQVTGESGGGSDSSSLWKVLRGIGFVTLTMDIGTFVYKPAHGVLFEHHLFAYYLTLGMIFLAGVAEVWTAFWLSQAHHDGHRGVLGRAVLCASLLPSWD